MINILNPGGTINNEGGEFAGMDRYAARKAIVSKMEELGHFEGVEDRKIPVKHSDRSKAPVEPYLSDQWFVKMDELAQSAMDAVEDGRVRTSFRSGMPKPTWTGSVKKRDWCISRQLWWDIGFRFGRKRQRNNGEQHTATGDCSLYRSLANRHRSRPSLPTV
ncbi:MAG: class I tRNA ligase family protein [Planctomycetaceae bacterium]